jgi:squalene-hopene/tetraprenyl-beta-curcumene cyclase
MDDLTTARSQDRPLPRPDLDAAISRATQALLAEQRDDGHFVYPLEADATIPAEYVLLVHYLGEPADLELERKIGVYLRRIQGAHGGWPLFHEGALDVSASVKAYFALKMIGDPIDAAHMVRAREAILAHGGAAKSNVFTRFMLATFAQVPWRAVPVMPIEIMHLPAWFPFHLSKISYWARTVLVPLMVIGALKVRAHNARKIGIAELFTTPPEEVRHWPGGAHQKKMWASLFGGLDHVLRSLEPHAPRDLRRSAINKAVAFVEERLNGEDGLGAIFPAMANSVMMFDALGIGPEDPRRAIARHSIDKLLVIDEHEAWCQPCVSPVWDTALAAHALLEVGDAQSVNSARRGLEWLRPRQILDVKGDWAFRKPDVPPGGWAFQYNNAHYPDLDDTAVVVMAMDRSRRLEHADGTKDEEAIRRATQWIAGLQSRAGGFGAFDADNDHHYLNNIPFADHGALLDPPTEDVTGRCLSMFAQLGAGPAQSEVADAARKNLIDTQMKDGSWFGRWGMNYIYGTWSALCALNAAGMTQDDAPMRRAVQWLTTIQNEDGGWGEDGASYKLDYAGYEKAPSTPSQTAWALLGLMAAGEVDSDAVRRGIAWLDRTCREDGTWDEERFTATGFPRVFYLRYHGYRQYFPLWAMARYRNLVATNSRRTGWGM